MLKVETGFSTGLTSTGCGLASKLLATWTSTCVIGSGLGEAPLGNFSQSDVLSRRAWSYEAYTIVSECFRSLTHKLNRCT